MPRGGPPITHDKKKPKPASKPSPPAAPVNPNSPRSRTQRGRPKPPDNINTSQLLDTLEHRQSWIKRVESRPGGAKKLAYFLKENGYDMSTLGPKGYQYALHGFLTLGTERDQVKRYNANWEHTHGAGAAAGAAGTSGAPPAANRPPAGADGPGQAAVDPLAGLPDLAGGGAAAGTDYGAMLNGLDPETAKLMNAQAYAKNQAGKMFDPQIAELVAEQRRQPGQAKQDQLDIKNWYKQVGDQQAGGITATTTANEAAATGLSRLSQSLVSAAGGNETAGGLVGAAATSDAGTLAATGASDLALANRLKELTSLEGATQGINEKRYQERQAHDTTRQVAELRGQKGATFAESLDKALAFNNQARQQNYANHLSAIQTQIGADAAGYDLAGKQVGLASAKVGLAKDILSYKQAQETLRSGGRVYWNKMAPDAKAGLVAAAVKAALGPGGNNIADYNKTRQTAFNWAVQTAGINNPAFRQSVERELKRLHPKWASQ